MLNWGVGKPKITCTQRPPASERSCLVGSRPIFSCPACKEYQCIRTRFCWFLGWGSPVYVSLPADHLYRAFLLHVEAETPLRQPPELGLAGRAEPDRRHPQQLGGKVRGQGQAGRPAVIVQSGIGPRLADQYVHGTVLNRRYNILLLVIT